jgi:O-antigen/teichoic acid export membrane protein
MKADSGKKLTSIFNSLISGKTARSAYLALFDQGIISVTNFIAGVYLARYATATQFGIYAVGFLLIRFVRALQEGVIVQPLNALGAPMDGRAYKKYFSATALLQLSLTVLAGLGAAVGGKILTALGNDTAGPALFTLWFSFLAWPAQEFIRRAFYSRGEVGKAALNSFISNALRFAYMLWMGSRGMVDGAVGLDAIAWGSLIALLVGLWGARDYFSWEIDLQEVWNTWKENWEVGRWVTGALISHWVSLEVYPLVVAGMISFAATGAYRALENLVSAVHVILRAMDTFITPYAARSFNEEGSGKLLQTLRWAYLFGGIPIVGILILALVFTEPLLKLLYEDAYLFMSGGIVWLVLFYFLWFTYWPIQSALKAIKYTQPLFTANLIAIVCMFTLGLVAVRNWGVNGAYIGQGLNALITNIVLWRAWLRLRKEGLSLSQ